MTIEIERKFLVDKEKWLALLKPQGAFYRQGYLADDHQKAIRVRVTPTQGFLTIKGAKGGMSRSEFEYEIPREEAMHLLDNFAQAEIVKTRYVISFDNNDWEIDVFSGDNQGLIIAEIELTSEQQTFEKPDWVGAEVTEDARYYNSNLVKLPFQQW